MSPIGRVFIVLNLILAGVFVGFAGTYLQRQHHWKTAHEELAEQKRKTDADNAARISELEQENRVFNAGKTQLETQLQNRENELSNALDDNKRLQEKNASLDADIKALRSIAEANDQTLARIVTDTQAAHKDARDAIAARDDAIRLKDAAESENRTLKNTIADLNGTVEQRDMSIASLTKEKSELGLLVDVAKAKGFLERMAVPPLAGNVVQVSGNLCTVQITDNPTNAEIKPGYMLAIYDEQAGYKAEARVTDVDAERNAAFCQFEIRKGDVAVGDRASTHLAGF